MPKRSRSSSDIAAGVAEPSRQIRYSSGLSATRIIASCCVATKSSCNASRAMRLFARIWIAR
jgi:hypothetical protein